MLNKRKTSNAICVLCLALSYEIYFETVSYYYAIALSLLFALFVYFASRKNNIDISPIVHIWYLVFPIVIGLLYSCFLFIAHSDGNLAFDKLFSRILFYSATLLQGVCLVILYGLKAIDLLFDAAAIFYSIRVAEYLVSNGIPSLFNYLYISFSGIDMSETSVLEAHEVTFVFGLFFIFYISKGFLENKFRVLIAFIFILFGYKRIMIPGLVVAMLSLFLVRKARLKRFIVALLTVFCYIGSLAWLLLIKNNDLSVLGSKYNINFMGRISLNSLISNEYEINPSYAGKGLGYLDVWSYVHAVDTNNIALHNDTALMYVELGFILFAMYYVYYLYLLYSKAKSSMKDIWPGLFCYTIICWATDNVQVYFNYQVVLMSILFVIVTGIKKEREFTFI